MAIRDHFTYVIIRMFKSMKYRKILFLGAILLLVSFNFGLRSNVPEASAAVCILKNITWMQANARIGDKVKFKIDGQDCASQKVTVKIMYDQTFPVSDTVQDTLVVNFPADGSALIGSWTITTTSGGAYGNSSLYLLANLDSAGTGTSLDSRVNGSVPYLAVAPVVGLNPSMTITAFDPNPKQIPANTVSELDVTFRAKVDTPLYFFQRCWQVQAFLLDDSGSKIYTQAPIDASNTKPDYKFDFKYRYDAKADGTVVLRGKVECKGGLTGLLVTLPTSSPVCIAIGNGVCTGTGGCGTSGQPACAPGSTQTYSFEIPNPLKGGVTDLASLVKILAQWIFNLAIPIAVAMIVYSGILFLTAAGDTAKVTKARDVLKYAVIGLAIILIGSGFISLIKSILELGGTGASPTGTYGPAPTSAGGAVGNKCTGRGSNCFEGLTCKSNICQRAIGNLENEPCSSTTNCDVGLTCDKSSPQVIDGQSLGVCALTVGTGGRIGEVCQRGNQCVSGLKCNQICQRSGGNLNGEACLSTSNPSNCQSRACHTVGVATEGVCVPYSGT